MSLLLTSMTEAAPPSPGPNTFERVIVQLAPGVDMNSLLQDLLKLQAAGEIGTMRTGAPNHLHIEARSAILPRLLSLPGVIEVISTQQRRALRPANHTRLNAKLPASATPPYSLLLELDPSQPMKKTLPSLLTTLHDLQANGQIIQVFPIPDLNAVKVVAKAGIENTLLALPGVVRPGRPVRSASYGPSSA